MFCWIWASACSHCPLAAEVMRRVEKLLFIAAVSNFNPSDALTWATAKGFCWWASSGVRHIWWYLSHDCAMLQYKSKGWGELHIFKDYLQSFCICCRLFFILNILVMLLSCITQVWIAHHSWMQLQAWFINTSGERPYYFEGKQKTWQLHRDALCLT